MGKRIFAWIMVLLLAFMGNFAIQYFSKPKTQLVIQYDTYTSPELSGIKKIKFSRTETSFNTKNPDVIFELGNEDKTGFKKYEEYVHSPLIMFTGDHVFWENSGFNVENLNSEGNYRKATKDFGTILRAMEQGKAWQDLGIIDSLLEGPIVIHIPDQNSIYHNLVKEMFLVNLGETITEENIEILLQRVDNLINKCVLVEDVEHFISSNAAKDELEKVMVIAPEFILKNGSGAYSTNSSSNKKITYMTPVYPTKTTSVDYSLYIKETVNEELSNKILEKYNSKKMVSTTGLRPTDADVDLTNSLSYHAVEDIKIERLPNNIKEKIYNHETVYESKIENVNNVSEEETTQEAEENVNEETKDEGMPGWVWFLIIIGIVCVLVLVFMFGVIAGNGY